MNYWWPFGDYKNADSGSAMERAAAFRHNRTLAKGLPAYLNRWSMVSCVLLSGSVLCPTVLTPIIGIAFTVSFCMTLHIAHVWLLFCRS